MASSTWNQTQGIHRDPISRLSDLRPPWRHRSAKCSSKSEDWAVVWRHGSWRLRVLPVNGHHLDLVLFLPTSSGYYSLLPSDRVSTHPRQFVSVPPRHSRAGLVLDNSWPDRAPRFNCVPEPQPKTILDLQMSAGFRNLGYRTCPRAQRCHGAICCTKTRHTVLLWNQRQCNA